MKRIGLWAFCASVCATPLYPQSLEWQSYSGPVTDIAVGANGVVAAIDTAGTLSQRDGEGQWRPLGSDMVQVQVSAGGEVWALDRFNSLWRHPAGEAPLQVATGLTQFALGPRGVVYAISSTGELGRFQVAAPAWEGLAGQATAISVDDAGTLWRVNSAGAIALLRGGAWIGVEGTAQTLWAAGGTPLIVDAQGRVRQWEERTGVWALVDAEAQTLDVASGAGQLWRIDLSGQLWAVGVPAITTPEQPEEPVDPAKTPDFSPYLFNTLPDNRRMSDLAIGPEGSVWAKSNSGKIWRWSNAQQKWRQFPGRVEVLSVQSDGLPIAIGTRAQLVAHDGRVWRSLQTDRALYDVSVGPEERLYTRDGRGQILYRDNLRTGDFNLFPLQGDKVVASPSQEVWVIGETGQLYRCGDAGNCRPTGQRTKDIAIGPGGTVFTVTDTNNLTRYEPATGRFTLLRQGDVTAVAVGPNDRPWILDGQGRGQYSRYFERDESGDFGQSKLAEATEEVTQEVEGNTGGGVEIVRSLRFTSAGVPEDPPGYDSLGPALYDITSGANDLVMATGYDNVLIGDDTPCLRGSGQNWVYDPSVGAFAHMGWLDGIILTHGVATSERAVGFVNGSKPPAGYATQHEGFFGMWARDCNTPELVTYVQSVFDDPAVQVSRDFSAAVLVIEGNLDTTVDLDTSADGAVGNVNRERHLEVFFPNDSDEVREFDQLEFQRIGMGKTEEDLWAVDLNADVYQFNASDKVWELRSSQPDDQALDVGVGFDGSVFIVNLAGILKQWDPLTRSFTRTNRGNVNRVAVSSRGKPIVANFPASSVVYFGR